MNDVPHWTQFELEEKNRQLESAHEEIRRLRSVLRQINELSSADKGHYRLPTQDMRLMDLYNQVCMDRMRSLQQSTPSGLGSLLGGGFAGSF